MVLHPQSRDWLERTADQPHVSEPGFDIDRARAEARSEAVRAPRVEVGEVRDLDADGVPCRLYRPEGARPGALVHLHGGGFVMGDVEVHDAACRSLAVASEVAVLSVDYRRPPEHPFPAAPDDVSTVLSWLDRTATELGLDGPTYLHGDSAGANLALVGALRHPGRARALVLVYPFLDPAAGFDSYRTETQGFDPRDAAWYWQQYARTEADLRHPDLAPLLAEGLAGLPPTLVVTAEHDPLRDEGEHLAARLAELGVRVQGVRWLGMLHGFWRHPEVFDAAEQLTGAVARFLSAESS